LRGANDGKDFSPEYLEEIYLTIKSREIIMPDEHDNDEAFEYAWKALLLKVPQAGNFKVSNPVSFDKYMFESTWLPVVTTLSYVFATATDDAVFARVITGFNQIAKLAHHYKLEGVVDHIVKALSKIAMLTSDLTAPMNNIVVEIEGTSITVSDFSVPFGSDFKAQMASVTLFRILKSYAPALNSGWKDVLISLATLYLFDLIPNNARARVPWISHLEGVKPRYKFKRSKAGKDVGLFSTLSSYLSGYNDAPQEPSDEDVDATLVAIDCINSCGIDEIIESLK
jgi:brefeldin A-resistance guanine nucleotide exchange factor 1